MLTPHGCELPEASHKGSRAQGSTPQPTASAHSRATSRGRRPLWAEAGRPSDGGLVHVERCHATHIKHPNYKCGSSLAYPLDTRGTVSPNLPGHVVRITWNACYHGSLDQAWPTGCQGSCVLDLPLPLGVSRGRGRTAVRIIGEAGVPPGGQGSGPWFPHLCSGGDEHDCLTRGLVARTTGLGQAQRRGPGAGHPRGVAAYSTRCACRRAASSATRLSGDTSGYRCNRYTRGHFQHHANFAFADAQFLLRGTPDMHRRLPRADPS